MNKVVFFIFLIQISTFSGNLFGISVYESEFHHVEIVTDNASRTKSETIKKIKIKSFLDILDRILTIKNKDIFLKKINLNNDLENITQNIIIENELIITNKYIADIKINFNKKEIINLLRKKKVNYSDIMSDPILIISSFTEELSASGLKNENIFYNDKFNLFKSNNNLINFIIPDLNSNDRYIMPYKKIVNNDNVSLFNISGKYAVENIFIIKIVKTNNKNFNVNISFYSRQTEEISIIGDLNLYNNMNLHKHILIYLTNWWKNKYLIDNKKHKIICVINSKNYSDLINIKNIIENLSQFKSLNLLTISYNNNIEKIEFYGDYDVLAKSLLLNKIDINISNGCIINSLNK